VPRSASPIFRPRSGVNFAAVEPGGLASRPRPTTQPRLTVSQQRRLDRLLRQGADAHGWLNRLWTTARVAQLIRCHFGVSYHPDHVGRFLRQRLGRSCQRPRRQARERDQAEIDHRRRHTFPRLLREARRLGAYQVFLDEFGYMLTPTVRRTWVPCGGKRRSCPAGTAATGCRPSAPSPSAPWPGG
jgi:transposase